MNLPPRTPGRVNRGNCARGASPGPYRTAPRRPGEGYSLLYEADRSAQELLERVARLLAPLVDSAPELAQAALDLDRLADEAREIAYTLRDLGRNSDDDPERLDEVEARLAVYRRLATRFHCGPDDLAAKRIEVETRLATIDHDDADLLALEAPLAAAWLN